MDVRPDSLAQDVGADRTPRGGCVFGQLRGGLQYSYTQRTAFASIIGGAPKASENTVLTSIRYYPL